MAINNVLISQNRVSDVFDELKSDYELNLSFVPFVKVVGITGNEFRKTSQSFSDHSAVIMTSRFSIDNYFRMAEELKYKISEDTKYFCLNEHIANYLQKYIVYRKRKIFFGDISFDSLIEKIKEKGNTNDIHFLPCSDIADTISEKLNKSKINFKKVILFKTVYCNLKALNVSDYNIILLFTPKDVESLFENFPNFKQNETLIGTFGQTTKIIAESKGLIVNIEAPTKNHPSMAMALRGYIEQFVSKI